jgi:hypothetical protein
MAWLVLKQISVVQAASLITRRYRVSKEQALLDYHQMEGQVHELISPNGACPICELELDTITPFSVRPSAPYRMDLAITYRCNNNCAHCYNARPRQYPELDTGRWKQILDKLWDAGIPHVVFTGGEPTQRPDLAQLVAYAEGKGQIAGINTNGRRLKDAAYLNEPGDGRVGSCSDYPGIARSFHPRRYGRRPGRLERHSGRFEKRFEHEKPVRDDQYHPAAQQRRLSGRNARVFG